MKKKLTSLLLAANIFAVSYLYSQNVSSLIIGPSTFDDCLTISQTGDIFASRYVGSTITKITGGNQPSIFASGINTPNGSDFGPDGYLYVPSNVAAGRIVKISPNGTVEPFITSITYPTAILTRSDDKMFICSCQENKIYLTDSTGNYSLLYSGNGMNCPVGLREDGNGNLLVANFSDGKIFSVNPSGVFSLIAQVPGIVGFIEFVNGYIYATGFSTNKIYKVTLSGQISVLAGTGVAGQNNGSAATATFNGPNGIVASLGGDSLFISDFNTRSLRLISNVSTGLINVSSIVPNDFGLIQNYPNPFNPATKISFEIPKGLNNPVSLIVYNDCGREISVLLNQTLSPGKYEVDFNAENLSSGIYYYRLTSGEFSVSKSMILLK